ncbi:hypothetical protein ACLMJK_009729 [Lecanora helva]
MGPKAQPRRKPPARGDQSAVQEQRSTEASHKLSNDSPSFNILPGAASPANAAASSPPPRRPVERLASVLPRNSSTPISNPHGESRPAPLKFKPKSFIRRSKEEREAVEKAEAERQAARLPAEGGGSINDRGGYSGRGRGGSFGDMSRWKQERFNLSQGGATGFLGGSTMPDPSLSRRGRGGRGGGGGSGGRGGTGGARADKSGSVEDASAKGGARVKKEPAVKPEKDKDGDTVMTSSAGNSKPKRTTIKTENQAPTIVSSEDELDSDGAERVNIERINLVTDDESTDDEIIQSSVARGKKRQRDPYIHSESLRPVRVQRQEHVERAVGVHTDSNQLTSAQRRAKAKERLEAEGSLFLPQDDGPGDSYAPKAKSRKKPKDVEEVGNKRVWKGVYQDDDEEDNHSIKIKDEPNNDNVMVVDVPTKEKERDPDAMEIDEEGTAPMIEPLQNPPPIIDKDLKTVKVVEDSNSMTNLEPERSLGELEERARTDPGHGALDHLEQEYWKLIFKEKYVDTVLENDINDIISFLNDPNPEPSTKVKDDEEPTDLHNEANLFNKSGHSYNIFNLPCILPSLRDAAQKPPTASEKKSKPDTSKPSSSKSKPLPPSRNPFASNPPIKPEPAIKPDPDGTTPPAPGTYRSPSFIFPPSGNIGTLRVHQKNRFSTDWGGLPMQVKGPDGVETVEELVVTRRFERELGRVERGGDVGEQRVRGWGEKGFGMGQQGEGWTCVPELGGLISVYDGEGE